MYYNYFNQDDINMRKYITKIKSLLRLNSKTQKPEPKQEKKERFTRVKTKTPNFEKESTIAMKKGNKIVEEKLLQKEYVNCDIEDIHELHKNIKVAISKTYSADPQKVLHEYSAFLEKLKKFNGERLDSFLASEFQKYYNMYKQTKK